MLALLPILGGLVWFAAVAFGLGVLMVAIRRLAPEPAPHRQSLDAFRVHEEPKDPASR